MSTSSSGSSSGGSSTRRRASHSSNGTARSARANSGSKARSATPSNALAEIRHDVAALRTDAVRLVHGLEEAAVEKVSKLTKRSRSEVKGVHEQIKEYIGQRPIVSVLVAAGVGALAAKLIRMR